MTMEEIVLASKSEGIGHLRIGRTFWRAAILSMLPFPMAHLFELGGATIWPAALLHFVVQGTVKVLVVGGEASEAFPLVWMMASAALPLFVFLIPRPTSADQTVAAALGGRSVA